MRRLIQEQGIQALLIGGHAVNVHGVVRATQDIDFMMAAADENLVRSVMRAEGYTEQISHHNVTFIHKPGSALRIDLLKVEHDTLRELWNERIYAELSSGVSIPVASLRHLLAMKISALHNNFERRQHKDLSDILELGRIHTLSFQEVLQPLLSSHGSVELEELLRKAWKGAA